MPYKKKLLALRTHLPLMVQIMVIFGVAMLLRLTLIYYNNYVTDKGHHLFSDSLGYYQTGVNLANGDGYNLAQGQPFYCREPGTSYFYAISVSMYKKITGRQISIPVYDSNSWPLDQDNQNIVMVIRLSQALLQAIAITFFFLLLRQYFTGHFSFITSLLVALYLPLAFFSEALLRENILFLLLTLIAYLFSSAIQKPAYWKLSAIGILWGAAALTLQVYMVLGVFLFGPILLKTKRLIPSLKKCAVIMLAMFITVLPWLCKVYAFFPDIRIVKSMGTAMTFDYGAYKKQLARAPKTEVVSTEPRHHATFYGDPKDIFQKTFSGFYKKQAAEMAQKNPPPSLLRRGVNNVGKLCRFFLLPGYITGYGSEMAVHDYRNSPCILFVSFATGILSVVGLMICLRKMVFLLPVYLFHLLFFWVLMSESRRALPIIPFFILLGIIGLLKIIQLGFPPFSFSPCKLTFPEK